MNTSDPGPFIAAFAAILPAPYAVYLGWAVGVASMACSASSIFTAVVRPPSSTAPAWALAGYRAMTWPALNLGWARNAVVPGMPDAVRNAALASAKLAAQAPELTQVVPQPVGPPAIVAAPAGPVVSPVNP